MDSVGSWWAVSVMVAGAISIPARAAAEAPAARPREELRRTLLIEYLEAEPGRADVERYVPAAFGTLSLAAAVAGPVFEAGESEATTRWVAASAFGAAAALSFSAYLAPPEYRLPIMLGTAGISAFGVGLAFQLHSATDTAAARVTLGSVMGAGVAFAGLAVLDTALKPRVSAIALSRHLERMKRGSLSQQEITAIERDYALSDRPIPGYAYPLTMVIGAFGALSPVLSKRTSEDDRSLALVFGSSLASAGMPGLIGALVNDKTYAKYVESLRRVELAPFGPEGSVGLSGSWTF